MVVIFDNIEVFQQVINPLPSGVNLDPVAGGDGRLVSSYNFSEEDIAYLQTIEGAEIMDGMPSDWIYPGSGL